MSFTIVKKDITTVEHGAILHGVNCQNVMGSGIALAIKTKWPEVYKVFKSSRPEDRVLGHIQPVCVERTLWVFNCFTQEFYGRDGKRYASVDGIEEAVEMAFIFAQVNKLPVFMPMIGCGLGGLDWKTEVEPVIETLRDQYKILVTICEK